MPRGGFRPGSGRPKGHLAKHTLEIRDAARRHGPEMIAELVRLAKKARMEQTRVTAIREILDRGYGKPKQEHELSGPDQGPIALDVSALTDDELRSQLIESIAELKVLGILPAIEEPKD